MLVDPRYIDLTYYHFIKYKEKEITRNDTLLILRIREGIYLNELYPFHFEKFLSRYTYTEALPVSGLESVCDNYTQIIRKYSKLLDTNSRKFIIDMSHLNNCSDSGKLSEEWRHYEEYIGDKISLDQFIHNNIPSENTLYKFKIWECL